MDLRRKVLGRSGYLASWLFISLVISSTSLTTGCGRPKADPADNGHERVTDGPESGGDPAPDSRSQRTVRPSDGPSGDVANLAEKSPQPRNTRPYQPADPRELHWLGDGYDLLNGDRKASCLEPDAISFRSYPINQTLDTMDLILSKEELAKKLSTQVNAEISGTYQGAAVTPSLKTTILRETNVTGSVLVAVASFVYAKDLLAIYESVPTLAAAPAALLLASKEQFRQQCGDKFTKSIRTGAALFLVVRAEQVSETRHSQAEIQLALKVGLGQFFGISPSSGVTREQKAILSQLRLSTRCYSEGVSGHPCADHQLNLASFNVTDVPIMERVNAAKKALVTEAMDRKITGILDEELDYYPVHVEHRGRTPFEEFFNYRPYLSNIREWLLVEDQVQSICQSSYRDVWMDQCRLVANELAHSLGVCAEQNEWNLDLCRSPRTDEFGSLRGLGDGGWIQFWDGHSAQGRSLRLELSDLLGRGASIRPNVIYNLHDDRFDFADLTSSLSLQIRKGWQVVLYEDVDGMGSKWVLPSGTQETITFPRWFDNKASSFIVKRTD